MAALSQMPYGTRNRTVFLDVLVLFKISPIVSLSEAYVCPTRTNVLLKCAVRPLRPFWDLNSRSQVSERPDYFTVVGVTL